MGFFFFIPSQWNDGGVTGLDWEDVAKEQHRREETGLESAKPLEKNKDSTLTEHFKQSHCSDKQRWKKNKPKPPRNANINVIFFSFRIILKLGSTPQTSSSSHMSTAAATAHRALQSMSAAAQK